MILEPPSSPDPASNQFVPITAMPYSLVGLEIVDQAAHYATPWR